MADQPNVVFVFADQMRASAMGCAGDPNVRTPALDGMAQEGVHFEHAYTPYPVCSPARGSILTGRYPHDHGVVGNTYLKLRLPTETTTVAEAFREEGYRTGYVGKWHLDGTKEGPGFVPPGPRRQGFDYWKGFNRGHQHLQGHPHFDRDGNVEWEEGYQPEIQTDLAIDFVEGASDDPFFCMMSWGPPHTPFEAPAEYSDLYDPAELELRENVPEEEREEVRETLPEYYGMVTSLDEQLGRVLDALEREGVADETIVVFTSDHGEMMGSQGMWHKGNPEEESVHVPLLVRYPDELPAGERSEAFVNLVDLFPTLASFAGAPVPDGVQGRDLADHFRDPAGVDGPTETYVEGAVPFDHAWRAVRSAEGLLAVDEDFEATHLYAGDDEYQRDNLAGEDDELEERLRESLYEWMYETDDRRMIARREIDL
ncbi:MAG: sulfatase [Halobacteriaceae archaeon]